MKKIFFITILLSALFFIISCTTDGNDSILDTSTDVLDIDSIETKIETPNNNNNELSNELAQKIVKNYEITLSYKFDENDKITYKDIFYYYSFEGCYIEEEKAIRPELVEFFDLQTGSFSIPYKIVDDFIMKRFNIIPDRYSIKYYNEDNEHYELRQNYGEFYYDIEILNQKQIKSNVYEIEAVIKSSIDDTTIPREYNKYVVELYGDEYKYLAVSTFSR